VTGHLDTGFSWFSWVLEKMLGWFPFFLSQLPYYSLFHSVLSRGIIFWGHSSSTQRLFVLQKRAIRLITGQGNRTSCRQIFKQLEIFPLKSQYIYSILLFVSKHKHFLQPILIGIIYKPDKEIIFMSHLHH
jgi:hypothetical protein